MSDSPRPTKASKSVTPLFKLHLRYSRNVLISAMQILTYFSLQVLGTTHFLEKNGSEKSFFPNLRFDPTIK